MKVEPQETSLLPESPGIYKYLNKQGKLIYVGKAKNLRKRVKSYFGTKKGHNKKTLKLVSEIAEIEVVITPTEFDALLLENNLIKANQPRYNILLKDDKTFPYICVSNERFPRIYATRQLHKHKGTFYGPYTHVPAMHSVLKLIQQLYTIRNCKYNLSEKNVAAGKYKICLEYHIGNCKGPCEGLQQEEDYLNDVRQAEQILKGNLTVVKKYFKQQMYDAAANLMFEQAQAAKEKLFHLEQFAEKTIVVNPKLGDLHIVSIIADDPACIINYMLVKQGAIIQSQTKVVKNELEHPLNQVLLSSLGQLIDLEFDNDKIQIITNVELPVLSDRIEIAVPQIGDKRKLIELSLKNAYSLKKERKLREEKPHRGNFALHQLMQDLSLTKLPDHIECFDNSNLQGTNPVASMVCFKEGKPSKKDYRKFKIKTVVGPDDFASMYEIVTRRYKRVLEENLPLPDLILIDGGKGQLSSAVQALKDLNIYGAVAIAGIAKRLEEIYVPEDSLPLLISKKSYSLNLLQRLRDEAHRFAITFHRQRRSKSIATSITTIPGIGAQTTTRLLKHFKSLKKVKVAEPEELEKVVGVAKAKIIAEAIKKGSI